MGRDYKVLDFKKGTWQDDFGNYWCDMALEGVGEPVRIAVKDPTEFHNGMTLYGSLETKQNKNGSEYLKFKREKNEEAPEAPATPAKSWQPESPERQENISRSVALNNAAAVFQGSGVEADDVLKVADKFYGWLRATNTVETTMGPTEPVNLEDIPY